MANNLRALRDARGWSQVEAAAALGTTRSQYVKLEGGMRRLSDRWIERAAKGFAVDAGQIVSDRIEVPVEVLGQMRADGSVALAGDVPAATFRVMLGEAFPLLRDWSAEIDGTAELGPAAQALALIKGTGGPLVLGRVVHGTWPNLLVQMPSGQVQSICTAQAWPVVCLNAPVICDQQQSFQT